MNPRNPRHCMSQTPALRVTLDGFQANCRQLLPYPITEGFPVNGVHPILV